MVFTHPFCMGEIIKLIRYKTPFRYNRVAQSLLQERKGVYMANKMTRGEQIIKRKEIS